MKNWREREQNEKKEVYKYKERCCEMKIDGWMDGWLA